MPARNPSVPWGPFGGVITIGIALHQLHEAFDGFEWVASFCPWCKFKRR